jgi:hypothetical protein
MEKDMKVPEGLTNCWAPDVVKGSNRKSYPILSSNADYSVDEF